MNQQTPNEQHVHHHHHGQQLNGKNPNRTAPTGVIGIVVALFTLGTFWCYLGWCTAPIALLFGVLAILAHKNGEANKTTSILGWFTIGITVFAAVSYVLLLALGFAIAKDPRSLVDPDAAQSESVSLAEPKADAPTTTVKDFTLGSPWSPPTGWDCKAEPPMKEICGAPKKTQLTGRDVEMAVATIDGSSLDIVFVVDAETKEDAVGMGLHAWKVWSELLTKKYGLFESDTTLIGKVQQQGNLDSRERSDCSGAKDG